MTGLIDGVPLAESVRDAAEAVGDGSWIGFGGAAYGAVSAVGDVVADPIGAIGAAGFGWTIEHNPILRTALNAVSGNPDAIESVVTTWTDEVATPLAGVAGDVEQAGASTSAGFQGAAADAYRSATTELAGHSEALGTAARAAAVGLSTAGTLVVEVRNTIRDELSSYLGWLVAGYAIAAAASVPTMGGSVATFTNGAILRGAQLGQKFAGMLRTLSAKLESFAGRLGKLGEAAQALQRLAAKVDGAAVRAADLGTSGAGSARVMNGLVNRWFTAAPTVPTGKDIAVQAGTIGIKAAGDGWKTWSGTAPAEADGAG